MNDLYQMKSEDSAASVCLHAGQSAFTHKQLAIISRFAILLLAPLIHADFFFFGWVVFICHIVK